MLKKLRDWLDRPSKRHEREDYTKALEIAIKGHVDHVKALMREVDYWRGEWHKAERANDPELKAAQDAMKHASSLPPAAWHGLEAKPRPLKVTAFCHPGSDPLNGATV